MNALPYLADLATRHAWARRQYARLHADLVEARLAARAEALERAERRSRRVHDLIGRRRSRAAGRPAEPRR
ncbi:hypothetical protein [Actinomadura sp. NEAU-AAG7]|uniref:hypothetical protein n=1 Tax=Actinomadura sp. NEAU-AAG7 TaxID=2839640 RepID=UPI001BE3FF6A|nr:hypothetical protein [Actinomadura sp. NEAU-AAG7]MBT2209377.1 hypothetical protein [Actinomadura sp. NEAU-AAG7]